MYSFYDGNGRGGIRTHGGFPHARFRVECLKPDSATLPGIFDYFANRQFSPAAQSLQRQSITGALRGLKITLTDGGIETRIIYEFKHAIGDFESFQLLRDESGRDILRRLYSKLGQSGAF